MNEIVLLPTELKLQILSYLKYDDISKVRRVSKWIRETAVTAELIFNIVCIVGLDEEHFITSYDCVCVFYYCLLIKNILFCVVLEESIEYSYSIGFVGGRIILVCLY